MEPALPFHDRDLPGVMHHADCSLCDWDEYDNRQIAQVLAVLHVIEKHPEAYRESTGKDPDQSKFEYREMYEALKARL